MIPKTEVLGGDPFFTTKFILIPERNQALMLCCKAKELYEVKKHCSECTLK